MSLSQSMRVGYVQYLRKTYDLAATRVRRVCNGLDLRQFTHASPIKRPARTVAVGRLVKNEGFADLIEAEFHIHRSTIGTGDIFDEVRSPSSVGQEVA